MWAELSDRATNAQRSVAPDTHVQNAIPDIDTAKIRKDAENAIADNTKTNFDFLSDRHTYSNKSKEEISGLQYAKAQELVDALQKAGFGVHILRSIADFGVSTYIQGMYGLKFRLSDHSVTSSRRIMEEDHIGLVTSAEYVLNVVREKQEKALIRAKLFDERAERHRLLDEKWERIKHLFNGLGFKSNNRTYQNFEKFSSNPRRSNILQTPLDVKFGEQAFAYEWTEPKDAHTVNKPSYNWLEHFDEDAAAIATPQFLRTQTGTIYGWMTGGEIYLVESRLNPDTPLHEYTHLWDAACRRTNPELWKRGVELMKQTPLWDEVKNDPNYANLTTDDEIAGEVHARLSGRDGAALLERMAEEAAEKDAMSMTERLGLVARLKKWMADFWRWTRDAFAPWTKAEAAEVSLDDFVCMPLADLVRGVNPNKAGRSAEAEMQEIKRVAQAEGTFMKAPNGKPSNLNERQWLQVRTRAFKRWFGDWEKAAKARYLLGNKYAKTLTGTEFQKDETPITKKVAQYYNDKFGGRIERKNFGEVILDERSVKDSIAHGIGRAKSAAFAAVPEIIRDGVEIDTQENWKGRNRDSYTFAAPVEIGGKAFVGVVIVTRGAVKGDNRFYLHEVILQENLQSERIKTDNKADAHNGDIAKVLKDILSAIENSSKVVDENGEPLVVYHGTPASFTKFRKGERAGLSGKGIYFAVPAEGVPSFGQNKILAFLNVRNPLSRDLIILDKYKAVNNGGFSAVDADIYDKFPEFDGVMVRRDEITVKNPNQIKSATDNNGEFSEANDDIRFSIGGGESAAIERVADAFLKVLEGKGTRGRLTKMVEEAQNGYILLHKMFTYLNEARVKKGLKPLSVVQDMETVAAGVRLCPTIGAFIFFVTLRTNFSVIRKLFFLQL